MSIINHQFTKTVNIVSFDISGVRIDLFQKATVCVVFRCDDGSIIIKDVIIQGEEYLLWGIDDDYIVNYITNNLSNILG